MQKFMKQRIMLLCMGYILSALYITYFAISVHANNKDISISSIVEQENLIASPTIEIVSQTEVMSTPGESIVKEIEISSQETSSEFASEMVVESEVASNKQFIIEDLPLSVELQEYTYELCVKYEAPSNFYYLMLALMERESSFDVNAISDYNSNGTRDYGICQLNSKYHDYYTELYGITDFMDPKQNIYCALRILLDYYSDYKNEPTFNQILMCYNLGKSGAVSNNKEGIYSTSYSRWIDSRMKDYQQMSVYDGGAL